MTVTSDSACNNPADSSVWSSSSNDPLARTFTLRILRSMGSSHCFFSCSIAFNSWMVFLGVTSTVMTPPSKVFTFSSWGMAAMAAGENLQQEILWRFRCVSKCLTSTDSRLASICTIFSRFGSSLILTHRDAEDRKIHPARSCYVPKQEFWYRQGSNPK